jgi:hypothetical protein
LFIRNKELPFQTVVDPNIKLFAFFTKRCTLAVRKNWQARPDLVEIVAEVEKFSGGAAV